MAQRFQTGIAKSRRAKSTSKSGDLDPSAKRKARLLDDAHIEALREFADDDEAMRGYWPDSKVFGLTVFLGAKTSVWRFRQQSREKGKRTSVFKTLGSWPAVAVDEARKAALIYSGTVAAGTAQPGRRTAMPFRLAFENYLEHLRRQAEEKGKIPRWYFNAKKLSDSHIMPQWDGWTLVEMSAAPRAVKTWYEKLSKRVPTSAAHCVRLIRACYRQEAGLDRSLNPAASPTSGIKLKKRRASQRVLDFGVFPAWRAAWDKLPNDVHRGYHLTALLTGIRPGELADLRLGDIDLENRMLTVRNPKAELDINLPITPQIAQAIAIAMHAPPQTIVMKGTNGLRPGDVRVVERKKPHGEVIADDLVFPGARQAGQRSTLPIAGNALRHTFRTIAVDCEISEMLIHFLCGHALDGVSEEYTNKLMIEKGPALRAAQEKISRRMFDLLGLVLGRHDAPIVTEIAGKVAAHIAAPLSDFRK